MEDAETIAEDATLVPAPPKPAPRAYAVKNFIDEAQLKIDVTYTLTNLSDAMQQQASMIIHYMTLAAKAARQVDDIKLVLEAHESISYRNHRDAALKVGEKITDGRLEKLVAGSPQIIAIKRGLNEAKQIEAIAKGAVEGFKNRKDMLVQEGAATRTERAGELRMSAVTEAATAADAIKRRVLDKIQGD